MIDVQVRKKKKNCYLLVIDEGLMWSLCWRRSLIIPLKILNSFISYQYYSNKNEVSF